MKKENTFKSIDAERFILSVQRLIDEKNANSFTEVAKSVGYASQDFTDIKRGKKDLQRKFLDAVVEKYGISKNFVLTGQENEEDLTQNKKIIAKPTLDAIPSNIGFNPDEFEYTGEKFIDLPDGTIMMWVPRVPKKAQAGYFLGFQDPEYFDEMEHIPVQVEKRHGGHYVIFEIKGDSMVPELIPENEDLIKEQAIWPGWSVLARELPKRQWQYKLHTHYVDAWVIVHEFDGILVKNIKHHDIEKAEITIHSLNPKYEDKVLSLNDVAQIFSVYRRLPPQY